MLNSIFFSQISLTTFAFGPHCDFQRDYYATFKRLSRVKSKKAHKKKEISIQAQNALKFARSFAQRIHCAYRATLSFFITKVCELDAKHPPIATYLFMIILFDPRDRTECICKSQTWLPACRDEHPDANAELSRGAGPLAELMRDVHSHKVSSVKYSNKKGQKARSTRFIQKFLQFRPSGCSHHH